MVIKIIIQDQKINISLEKDKKEVDFKVIIEERSLSERLLLEIDALLRRNKLKTEDINELQVESDQADSFTTTRIAKAVSNTWNWAAKKESNKVKKR